MYLGLLGEYGDKFWSPSMLLYVVADFQARTNLPPYIIITSLKTESQEYANTPRWKKLGWGHLVVMKCHNVLYPSELFLIMLDRAIFLRSFSLYDGSATSAAFLFRLQQPLGTEDLHWICSSAALQLSTAKIESHFECISPPYCCCSSVAIPTSKESLR